MHTVVVELCRFSLGIGGWEYGYDYILSGLGLRFNPIYFYIGKPLPNVKHRKVLVYFIIKQYIFNLKNNKYIVKNSLLDKFQTIFKFTMGSL